MKINKKAVKHNSPIINELLAEITPTEKMQVRTKMELSARLDDLIKDTGLGKREFALRLRKNPSEISKWLSGTHNFTIDTLVEVAGALNISVQELFAPKPIQFVNKIHFAIASETRSRSIVYDTPFHLPSAILAEPEKEQYFPLTPSYC